MYLIKIIVISLLVVIVGFLEIKTSFTIVDQVWTIPLWKLLLYSCLVVYLLKSISILVEWICSALGIRPDVKKGVNYLQQAFSGLLIKDQQLASKALHKARKHLGDIPIISWMEGQLHLISGDIFKAKSLFFNLNSTEKDTILGAYSLAHLALQDGSEKESVEAIKSILKVYPNSKEFTSQIIGLSLKNGNIDDAFYYLKKSSKVNLNKKEIKAVICFEKWKLEGEVSDLKSAYKLAPQISNIAIAYAEELVKHDENKSAKKVLLKSFEIKPFVDTLKAYITLADNKLEAGEKLLKLAPDSWIPHYYMSKVCLEVDMDAMAFQYISLAFEIAPYSFIADELIKINARIDGGNQLLDLSKARNVRCFWKCSECGEHSEQWKTICPHCLSVATYSYEEEIDECLPVVV